ncbi:RagB/SusD family nutrient uptake outer membrane protein [Flammeovirga sp. EKP202]|uniref:RagB/SusD family nutrient uptake outer membrane protein n=1 Tax=Flammeovirga sp. EKP202 TaxID=2770592 RepID=UPI00165F686D|nr:RagB/SusD family nutrient uptake outer membrane protein [Flammeovirga sp. EKP202]MBD0401519.1 RagB/SusD family nutrient uptake outer membrane protein [Flammeovirga sp. EKP202]
MKKLKHISGILLVSLLIGCESNLDVKPVASIDAKDAITDANGLNSALMGMYNDFQSDSYYGRDLYILGALSSNDGQRTGTSLDYQQFENHSILSDNASIESFWSSVYTAINTANNIIERGETIVMDEEERNNTIGEAYFMRALAHFDLLKNFGGVPYKVASTQGINSDINLPRLSREEVYTLILQDLATAKERITLDKGNFFVSSTAVDALMARVELYYGSYLQNTNQDGQSHYQKALDLATSVTENSKHELELDYGSIFTSKENTEVIFQLNYSAQDRNRMSYYLSPTSLGGRGEVSFTNGLSNSYKRDDARSTFIFQEFPTLDGNGTGKRVAKYQDTANGADPIVILRLAEMYLIQAESHYRISGMSAEDKILEALNAVRERAITPLTSLGSDPIRTILDERRWELCFEGHRWNDLVRTDRATSTLGISVNSQLYPIPLKEIQTNTSINQEDQNPGY